MMSCVRFLPLPWCIVRAQQVSHPYLRLALSRPRWPDGATHCFPYHSLSPLPPEGDFPGFVESVGKGPSGSSGGWMSSASSHSKSHSVEVSARRSRDLSCLFGDSRSIVVLLSSREASPVDSRVKEALATMRSCFNIDSTVVVYRMVEDRKNYYIPPEYELNDPLSGQRPYDGFSSGFNLSTDALEAGLRFALHPMIEACLEGW
ncbi:hypothetical protein BHE74_00057082 [Ensete ventricosum]|uniref:Uncharacterized protein n=1 Tax=Ensete ventricosum TaxID=4639 RepID=A0A445MKH9_ENSVE|nr:hypothetical protein BHE74_00057082 [Ensete ventricosum]RZR74708.1 hypothetical protein BHM03_00041535 [Ensete ventricosum]